MSDDSSDDQSAQPRITVTHPSVPDLTHIRDVAQRFFEAFAPQLAQRRREIAEARERYEWLGPILDDYDQMERVASDAIGHALPHPSHPDTYVIVPREKIDALQDVVDR